MTFLSFQIKYLASIKRHLAQTVATMLLVLFISSSVVAQDTCRTIFSDDSKSKIVNQIYMSLTYSYFSSWSKSTVARYFSNKDYISRDILSNVTPDKEVILRYVHSKLNDPVAFMKFLDSIVIEIAETKNIDLAEKPDFLPTREEFLSLLHEILIQEGFTLKSIGFLSPVDFYNHIKEGTIGIESAFQLANEHGFDSHIIQMAYITKLVRVEFGEGKALEFYKYMGQHYRIWSILFDSPDTDHLGNPAIIKTEVSGKLGLK